MSKENQDDKFSHIKHEDFGSGMGFSHGYKDFEEMMAHMAQQEERANARLLPEQREMIDCEQDQWYINLAVSPKELIIVGEAWSLLRNRQEELELGYKVSSVDQLDDEQKREFASSMAMTADSRKRGYIFGRAYSEIEPEGELGSTHVANMWPITEAAFNEAKEQNWRPDLFDNKKTLNLRTCLMCLKMRHGMGR